jgi:hypothetical protein
MGDANAYMHRNRRRGRNWPDLVGRRDVKGGPRAHGGNIFDRNVA